MLTRNAQPKDEVQDVRTPTSFSAPLMALALAASVSLGLSACGHSSTVHGSPAATTTSHNTVPGQVLIERLNQVKSCGPSIGFDGRAIEDKLGNQLPQLSVVADRLAEVTPHGDTAFINNEVDQIAYYRAVVWSEMVVGVHDNDPNMDLLLQADKDSFNRFLDHTVVELEQGKNIPDPDIDGLFPPQNNPCSS